MADVHLHALDQVLPGGQRHGPGCGERDAGEGDGGYAGELDAGGAVWVVAALKMEDRKCNDMREIAAKMKLYKRS